MNPIIRRDHYLQKLIDRKENGLIKVITGIRRCGKSFLLFDLFYDHLIESGVREEQIIPIALDDDMFTKYRDPDELSRFIRSKIVSKEMYYILIDEVQYAIAKDELKDPESIRLYNVLNGLMRLRNVDIYVTGSNSKFLSKDIITEFAGRGDEIRMYPLSFAEFMTAYSGDKYTGLSEYMLYGGIPLVVLRNGANEKSAALQSLFDEIYIRDIEKRNKIRNIGELEDLLNILSSSIGSLTNPEKLSNTFKTVKKSKITATTIRKYLGYLEDSFLIESTQRYDIKGRNYIETPRKYYFSDLGLRNARINFRQFEQTHSMENVIYNELRMRGYNVDVGVVPVAERDANGKIVRKQLEVDFVCNMGSLRYYIQSAYSLPDEAKRAQEVRPFRKIDDSFKKIIVTKDIVPAFYDENGILTMNIYDFLLDVDSLEKTQ